MMMQERYETAREQFWPSSVNRLFVAEAPPCPSGRYFYFPDVHLWIVLEKALYPSEFGLTRCERQKKHGWLKKFCRDSNWLIDALKQPMPPGSERSKRSRFRAASDRLILECKKITPRQIILIKATVYGATCQPLKAAGLPVIDAHLPFPGSGRQQEFHNTFEKLVNDGVIII